MAGGKWDGMMDYAPRGLSHFKMPRVATEADIAATGKVVSTVHGTDIPASDYKSANRTFATFQGLGVNGVSIGIWPMDMIAYQDVASAPYVEYSVPVKAGDNKLILRFVPSFPINANYNMRYAISIDGKHPVTESIRLETSGKGKNLPKSQTAWNISVLRGCNSGEQYNYNAIADGNVTVRIYFLDPGLLLSSIHINQ